MMDWGSNIQTVDQPAVAQIDQNASDGVMIALVPTNTEWCKIACPHMTLVYVGQVGDLKSTIFNELGKEASDLALLSRPITLKVSGTEEFGGQGDPAVEVLTLQSSPELRAMRRAVEHWNASDWPFNPHVTVGPVGTSIDPMIMPTMLTFDKLMVAWGTDELIFSLGRTL